MVIRAILNFCKFILKSVLASAIVLVASLSVMTNKFPPDFSQIKSTYEIFRNLQSASSKKNISPVVEPESVVNNAVLLEDEDTEQLIQQRQRISAPLADIASSRNEEKGTSEPFITCEKQDDLILQLKSKIEELDKQNLTLNQKILDLKYNKQ